MSQHLTIALITALSLTRPYYLKLNFKFSCQKAEKWDWAHYTPADIDGSKFYTYLLMAEVRDNVINLKQLLGVIIACCVYLFYHLLLSCLLSQVHSDSKETGNKE